MSRLKLKLILDLRCKIPLHKSLSLFFKLFAIEFQNDIKDVNY